MCLYNNELEHINTVFCKRYNNNSKDENVHRYEVKGGKRE